jgi:hypothetical protein
VEAAVESLKSEDRADIAAAVNSRIQQMRYVRSTMRALYYLKHQPNVPREGDEKKLQCIYERKRWIDENSDETGEKSEKRGDFTKVVSQVKDLRKNSAIRRNGSLPTFSTINYRQPSRFSTDLDMQSDLLVSYTTQAWPGVADTSYSTNGRGMLLFHKRSELLRIVVHTIIENESLCILKIFSTNNCIRDHIHLRLFICGLINST